MTNPSIGEAPRKKVIDNLEKIKYLIHQAETGKTRAQYDDLKIMLLYLLTIFHMNSWIANAESIYLWSERVKATNMIGDSILFCYAKDYFHPVGPIVWIKDGVKILNHINGRYFG